MVEQINNLEAIDVNANFGTIVLQRRFRDAALSKNIGGPAVIWQA